MTQIGSQDTLDFLQNWDDGNDVISVDLSGFGGGYEQACQIIGMEYLRTLIENNEKFWKLPENKQKDKFKQIEEIAQAKWAKKGLRGKWGPSGAQVSAGFSFGAIIFKHGYKKALSFEAVKDRKIVVNKNNSLDTQMEKD